MEEWARSQTTITPDANGDKMQQALAKVAAAAGEVRACHSLLHLDGGRLGCPAGVGLCCWAPRVRTASSWPCTLPPTDAGVASCHPSALIPANLLSAILQGKFLYTKFFAVGLFRLVELTGAGGGGRAGGGGACVWWGCALAMSVRWVGLLARFISPV